MDVSQNNYSKSVGVFMPCSQEYLIEYLNCLKNSYYLLIYRKSDQAMGNRLFK